MTNRLATDELQSVVWRWEGEAFGNTAAEELAGFSINLRFPGQYFDVETDLHYNQQRYYDPQLGRYITSDHIGLEVGLNTYIYVAADPITSIDITGEYRTKSGHYSSQKPRNGAPPRPGPHYGKQPEAQYRYGLDRQSFQDLTDSISSAYGGLCGYYHGFQMKRIRREMESVKAGLTDCDAMYYQIYFRLDPQGCPNNHGIAFSRKRFPTTCYFNLETGGGRCFNGVLKGDK